MHTNGDESSVSASTQSLAASDGDSAVAMDFQEIAASPDMTSCLNCHANLKGSEECVVCRVEVSEFVSPLDHKRKQCGHIFVEMRQIRSLFLSCSCWQTEIQAILWTN